MTRRRALWVTGIASVVLFAVEAAFDLRMQDAGGHGIIDFELAGSLEHSRRMLEFWGHDGHAAARWSLWFDYPFLIAYGAFWTLAVAAVRDIARRQGWRRFAAVAAVVVAFPIAAATFDAIEDVGLLLALGRHAGAFAPRLATVSALLKFVLIELAVLVVLVGLARRALERRPAPAAIVLGVIMLAIGAFLVNGVVAQDRTAAADASAGRIVRLPGGALHVSDEGPRSSDAIVLIPGWGCSMAFWQPAGRVLARTHRVVRLDPLGFGASSKPASGYSMQNEARLVLGAVRRLGVQRALVVGHSMGGVIAVAAAARDPRLVRGVAVLDTEPAGDGGTTSLTADLLFTPVVGAGAFDLASDSTLRNGLKPGFRRGFHVPDRFVRDLRGVTWTALTETAKEARSYRDRRRLDRRLAPLGLPLLVIYGTRDRLVDPKADRDWHVPGARIVPIAGAGHSPQVERPRTIAGLIARFAHGPLRP